MLAIQVPRADYTIRPVFINKNLLRGTYMRNNEGDYHCPEGVIRMMLRDSFPDGNDRMFLENYTMAGLLMFGKGLPVRERFDNLRLDYIDKSHLIGDQRDSDRLTYDGTWENNLYNFATFVLPRLTKELPRPFKMDGTERDDDTPQHKAVREALTNVIIHADFVLDGILKVEKYDDSFVFTNPGLLKIPVEQIYSGYETRTRNQRIQNMFRMIGFGENLGSGFPLILSAWDEKHWLRPELVEHPELHQIKLTLHIQTADVVKDVVKDLSERQRLILDFLRQDNTLSARKMSERLSQKETVSERTVQRDLDNLREKGVLSRKGGRANGEWVIKDMLH